MIIGATYLIPKDTVLYFINGGMILSDSTKPAKRNFSAKFTGETYFTDPKFKDKLPLIEFIYVEPFRPAEHHFGILQANLQRPLKIFASGGKAFHPFGRDEEAVEF